VDVLIERLDVIIEQFYWYFLLSSEVVMTRVAVVGAGQAGLIFSHKLLSAGIDVTLYSQHTPEQWLRCCAPTGTAFLYDDVLRIERELGLDYWADHMHVGDGLLLDYCGDKNAAPITVKGRFGNKGAAVDQRMKNHRWLHDFINRGGSLITENVNLARLDEISQQSDLTVLATGKSDLSKIIPLDTTRSIYQKPQRHLAMAIVQGVDGWREKIGFNPVKFTFLSGVGEYFWVPYTHKSAGDSWSMLIEAKPGSSLDCFTHCRSGHEVVSQAKAFIKKNVPWEYETIKSMSFVEEDEYAWLKGGFPPTVRKAFGHLPSGRPIMPIGDSSVVFDPIGGQGGNNATRNAFAMAEQVILRAENFDESWMNAVNQNFWESTAKNAFKFNNSLLEMSSPAMLRLIERSADDESIANQHFAENFSKPNAFYPWLDDISAVEQL
jgi:Styrene monooxygenase A putative substrate binding domain